MSRLGFLLTKPEPRSVNHQFHDNLGTSNTSTNIEQLIRLDEKNEIQKQMTINSLKKVNQDMDVNRKVHKISVNIPILERNLKDIGRAEVIKVRQNSFDGGTEQISPIFSNSKFVRKLSKDNKKKLSEYKSQKPSTINSVDGNFRVYNEKAPSAPNVGKTEGFNGMSIEKSQIIHSKPLKAILKPVTLGNGYQEIPNGLKNETVLPKLAANEVKRSNLKNQTKKNCRELGIQPSVSSWK